MATSKDPHQLMVWGPCVFPPADSPILSPSAVDYGRSTLDAAALVCSPARYALA